MSGTILKEKADNFAKRLPGHENFKATDGWLSRWKVRHGIKCKKAHGEKNSSNVETAEKWKEDLPNLLRLYDPDNIYNSDEIGLFCRATPDGFLVYKHTILAGHKKR
ncbi:tigger transposable element-derived protein 6-like [Onthophagus taurus]|uniref:tigger transposable element-derived protein 6-like n=1 Tax=Onthophagus taurus TaxID=166361 RepID=UPI0039BEAD97